MKKLDFRDRNHLYGRIFLGIAIGVILLVPVIMAIVLKVFPNMKVIGISMIGLIVFIAGGFVEVATYSPMLGTAGTYLGFITGNLVNLKVPCAVNARELAKVKNGSKEGEIVSTISVATSTIVTTLIIALGVALLTPLTPVFENETLIPAFGSAFTALFAALAYKYFIKDPLLVPVPFALAITLALTAHLGTTVDILIVAIASIFYAYFIFKKIYNKVK